MSNKAADTVADYFRENGTEFKRDGDNLEKMYLRYGGGSEYNYLVIFDEDSSGCELRATDIVSNVPDYRRINILETLNRLNSSYRWVTFYLTDNGSVTAQDDAVIDLKSCGEEVNRCLIQLSGIVDEAYPEIITAAFG